MRDFMALDLLKTRFLRFYFVIFRESGLESISYTVAAILLL